MKFIIPILYVFSISSTFARVVNYSWPKQPNAELYIVELYADQELKELVSVENTKENILKINTDKDLYIRVAYRFQDQISEFSNISKLQINKKIVIDDPKQNFFLDKNAVWFSAGFGSSELKFKVTTTDEFDESLRKYELGGRIVYKDNLFEFNYFQDTYSGLSNSSSNQIDLTAGLPFISLGSRNALVITGLHYATFDINYNNGIQKNFEFDLYRFILGLRYHRHITDKWEFTTRGVIGTDISSFRFFYFLGDIKITRSLGSQFISLGLRYINETELADNLAADFFKVDTALFVEYGYRF